ncbi:MAG: glycosyltransferase family 1 protein [Alphaproteobacteria bacterium]|nr:glycosyltransferase family 1 protein [Alphaproteobacteria bacterium]
MTKILFSVLSNVASRRKGLIDSFFQNFIDSLTQNGNEVFLFLSNDFIKSSKDNVVHYFYDKEDLINKVNHFSPELIITPNHEIPLDILENTSCPILVYTADSPAYFRNKKYIKENKDRYFFMHGGWNNIFPAILKEIYDIKEEQNFYIGHTTNVQADPNAIIKRNIGFIGFIGWPGIAVNTLIHSKTQEEFIHTINEMEKQGIDSIAYTQIKTSNIRIKVLDAIQDLGLEVFGIPNNFIPCGGYSWELMKCFNFKQVLTTKENEEILNSSLISPNLYNYQAPNGLSWRVSDVMASNAALISPPKDDLKKLSPYIDIPTYETPSECRDLCQKLLKDTLWRKELVEGSQKAINEFCRPIHTLEKIEKYMGIDLIHKTMSSKASNSSYKLTPFKKHKKKKISWTQIKYKIYYKIWKHFNKQLKKKGFIS